MRTGMALARIAPLVGVLLVLMVAPPVRALEAVDGGGPATLVWLSTESGWADSQARAGAGAYDSAGLQTRIGLGHSFSPRLHVTAGLGRGHVDVDPQAAGDDHSRVRDWQLGLRYSPGDWSFGLATTVRRHETRRSRVDAFAVRDGVRRLVLDARIVSKERVIEVDASRSFDLGERGWLTPQLRLSHVRILTDDFIEAVGERAVLAVTTAPEEAWFGSAELAGGTVFFAGDWVLTPSLRFALDYRLDQERSSSVSTFVGTRYGYAAEGVEGDPVRVIAGAGFAVSHLRGFGVRLDVRHERQSDFRLTAMGIGIDYDF